MAARGLFAAALVESAIVTWRDISQTKVPPPPSDFVAVAIIYGGLSLLPASGEKFAILVGWGFVVATFLNFWNPTTPTKLAVPGGKATLQSGQQTTVTPGTNATTTKDLGAKVV